jgi:transposase
VEVMGRVKAGSLRLCEAAEMLGLSYRQSKRIWARYRAGGAKALQHGNCGRVSNRAYGAEFRAAVLKQVKTRYEDFGPTLACEHLASDDGLQVHAETLRRWSKEAGCWQRQRRREPYRQRRPTARQLDEVFCLEEERVLSEDWVVRYQNRLLQLERPSRPRIPAKSRVMVRENQAGETAIHYLLFREVKPASKELSEGRGAAPSPAPPSPKPKSRTPSPNHPWRRNRYQQMKTPIFSAAW